MGSKLAEAKASMDQLIGKARSQLEAMRAESAKVPFPEHSVMMKLKNAETDQEKVGKLYERVLVLSDFKETEKDSLAFREIESLFYNTRGLVWEAQATHRNKRAIKPKEPVAKEVAKASASGDSTIKKNLQKKTSEPTMKPSAA